MKAVKINKILISGIFVIMLGIVITTILSEGIAGLVMIAIGGLIFLLGLKEKQDKSISG